MSWRTVVITTRAKLELRLSYLVVRGEKETKIHLSEISTLIIESTSVSLTVSLLSELMKKKIKVIFCDEKRNPISELIPYYGSHDTSAKVRHQIKWTKSIKGYVWTEIVREKITKQADLLRYLKRSEAKLLETYLKNIEYNDKTNREGHAAKVYFNALFGINFTRTKTDFINAALDYGYAILLSAVNREIVSNGYITQIGIFHDNMFNQFNLGSDLMEPFRPIIDACVYYMNPTKFELEERMMLVNLLNKEIEIDGRKQYLSNAIKIYCKSIFDALNENDVAKIRFYKDEL